MNKLFALLLFACFSVKAATTIVTETIKESGGTFSSLQAWEANLGSTNLVTADKIYIASIEGSWTNPDTTAFTISGPTTGPNNYLVITNTSSKHLGLPNTANAYKLYVSNPTAGLYVNVQYMRIYGVYVQVHSTSADNKPPLWLVVASGGSEVHIRDCFLETDNTSTYSHYAANCTDTDLGTVYFVNNVLWGRQTGGLATPAFGVGAVNSYVWNNTLYSAATGFYRAAGTISCYNNIAYAAGGNDYTGISSGSDYNFSSDATSTGGAHDKTSITPVFNDAANGDFTTKDFRIVGRGTTDPGSGWYSTDTKGTTRTAPWDVGAFEFANGPYRISPIINVK